MECAIGRGDRSQLLVRPDIAPCDCIIGEQPARDFARVRFSKFAAAWMVMARAQPGMSWDPTLPAPVASLPIWGVYIRLKNNSVKLPAWFYYYRSTVLYPSSVRSDNS
eukprot:SAG22_NODE_89_length_21278_cov_16.698758_11_plen_108_part_00